MTPWMVLSTFVAVVGTAGALGVAAGQSHAPPPTDPTRLVGRGQFVVEVPKDWATGERLCDDPLRPTVLFWTIREGPRLCATRPSSYVKVGPLRMAEAPWRHLRSKYLAVLTSTPDDARIFVTSNDRQLVRRIAASAHRLPDGWTTAPALVSGSGCEWRRTPYGATWDVSAWVACIKGQGLVPRVEFAGRLQYPLAREISPREGTPVRRGSTVTIHRPESALTDH